MPESKFQAAGAAVGSLDRSLISIQTGLIAGAEQHTQNTPPPVLYSDRPINTRHSGSRNLVPFVVVPGLPAITFRSLTAVRAP